MRFIPFLFIAILCSTVAQAQNLVLNPGLETYTTCPSFGQFGTTWIPNWSKPNIASSDYYQSQCPGIVPTNQTPFSGNAYAGIIAYNLGTEYREYITGKLSSPLLAGKTYYVEFEISLHDNYVQAIQELGAYLSNTAPGPFPNVLHINAVPQIQNSSGLLSNKTGWTTISGSVIATGGEEYITIGNFNADSATTIQQVGNVGSFGAYYFVDEVRVIPEPEGVAEYNPLYLNVFPNPAHGQTAVYGQGLQQLAIYNTVGQLLEIIPLDQQAMARPISINHLPTAMYLLIASDGHKRYMNKLIVQ